MEVRGKGGADGATNDAYSKPGAEEREAKERQKRRKVDYCKSKLRLRAACACEVNFACRLFSMARSRPVHSRFKPF